MTHYAGFNKNICQNIKKYRNEKSVRLMNLAEKLDVSVNYLNRIEKVFDRNKISLMTLYEISIILGVRIDKSFEK